MKERENRRWSYFTMQDVQTIADTTPVERYRITGLGQGPYMPAFTEHFKEERIIFRGDDGNSYTYEFLDDHHLTWCETKGIIHHEYYEALELPDEKGIFLIQHYVKASVPPTAHSIVLDENTGLFTLCIAHVGVADNPREIARTFHFGCIAGKDDPRYRHHFTDDLVGTAIRWTYHDEEKAIVKHVYTAPQYYTYQMTFEDGHCWVASNPANYVRINDHVYIFSFVEERQAGTQGFFLINMETLHDVGSFFGIQAHGMECCMFGAKGQLASPFAVEWCEEK